MPSPRAPITTGRVVELLDHADRAVDAVLTPTISAEGLSREGWRVLLFLSRGPGRSMGEIAEHASVPNPTATRVVDRLVTQSLASRRSDPRDRRRVLVHLAPHGRLLVERVSRQLERRIDATLGHLPADRATLGTLLSRIADALPLSQ